MFKPGEIAIVKESGRGVIVTRWDPRQHHATPQWPVVTDGGVFDETELAPGHPSVVATAKGLDQTRRDWAPDDAIVPLPAELRAAAEEEDRAWHAIAREVATALSNAAIDFNGHWKNGVGIRYHRRLATIRRADMSATDAGDILRAKKTKTPMDKWVPVHVSEFLTCPYCGGEDFDFVTNGVIIRITGERCRYENGLPPAEWELNVPSGKLVVANDLRRVFPLPDDGDDFSETLLGLAQTSLAYATIGLSHAFVGNSCPGVYKVAEGAYKVANPPQTKTWEDGRFVPVEPPLPFEGEEVAGICTDLWWYSICDSDEFERRCAHFGVQRDDLRATEIAVRPGVYRFQHDVDVRSSGHGERVYARFTWVRDPDPVHNFLGAYMALDVHAHAYVQAKVARWPTLYGKTTPRNGGKELAVPWSDMAEEDRRRAWARVGDHIFFTIGGGTDWHENGFPQCKVDATVPDIDPPEFREQRGWYPFASRYGGMSRRTLAPSFAKLLFRMLESVISFGMRVRSDAKGREVEGTRERMRLAVKRYRSLLKQCPAQADPEYAAWIGEEGRAEAWVENFNLGPEVVEAPTNRDQVQARVRALLQRT